MLSPREISVPADASPPGCPNYEHRDEQLAMAEAVDRAISPEAITSWSKPAPASAELRLPRARHPRRRRAARRTGDRAGADRRGALRRVHPPLGVRRFIAASVNARRRHPTAATRRRAAMNRRTPKTALKPTGAEKPSPCRVIVSTHTISLQETVDAEGLAALEQRHPDRVFGGAGQGRGNYLSLRRLANANERAAGCSVRA